MGACATKPKVNKEEALAPETKEESVRDGEKVAVPDVVDREIVDVVEEKKNESMVRKSLSNLLNEGDDKLTESAEKEVTSESIKQEQTAEKGTQSTELPKQEQVSVLEKRVSIEADGTFEDCKSELVEIENPEVTAPQGVTSEALKVVTELEKVTVDIAVASEIISSSETPKTSEVSKIENAATPVVLKPDAPKPAEGTKSEDAAPVPVVPVSETPKPSEVAKTINAAPVPVVPVSEPPKPTEVTKTENAAPALVPKSETPKPSEVTKTEVAAPVVQTSETPKPSETKPASLEKKPTSPESAKA